MKQRLCPTDGACRALASKTAFSCTLVQSERYPCEVVLHLNHTVAVHLPVVGLKPTTPVTLAGILQDPAAEQRAHSEGIVLFCERGGLPCVEAAQHMATAWEAAAFTGHVCGAEHDTRCRVPESEQKPAGASLIATAAAVPPLEPPTCMMLLYGFSTGPPLGLMVVAPKASSCMRVLPRTMPLAFSRRDTRAELLHGILPAQDRSGPVRALTSQGEVGRSR